MILQHPSKFHLAFFNNSASIRNVSVNFRSIKRYIQILKSRTMFQQIQQVRVYLIIRGWSP